MKKQTVGIVGSGHIGGNLGVMLGRAGYKVIFSSRHPEKLVDLARGAGKDARTAPIEEAMEQGDIVVLSVPLRALPELGSRHAQRLRGKVVLETSNPYPDRDGDIAVEASQDPGGLGTFVARLFLVRAFNTVYYKDLEMTVNSHGETIGIPLAGDDEEALTTASELTQQIGLDPVVVGDLASSKRFDKGSPVYATSMSAQTIRKTLGLG